MAEQEERILIVQWNINHDICPAPTEYQCGISKSCDDCKVGMSRQEAIERMAKAIQSIAVDRGGLDLDDDTVFDPRMFAESALNALLEGNK